MVIKGNRVVKARPGLNSWKVSFQMNVNSKLIPIAKAKEIILPVLVEGGERVGLLDFRPQNKGDFGCYKVTKFNVKQ